MEKRLALAVARALLERVEREERFSPARRGVSDLASHDALETFCEWILGSGMHIDAAARKSFRDVRALAVASRLTGNYPFGFNAKVYLELLCEGDDEARVEQDRASFMSALRDVELELGAED